MLWKFDSTELNQFVEEWNSHRIRPSKTANAPAGIGNVFFPSLTGMISALSFKPITIETSDQWTGMYHWGTI